MLRSPTDAVRREQLARDLLHDGDGALAPRAPPDPLGSERPGAPSRAQLAMQRGTLLTGGADWLIIGQDGWGRLDVRAQVQMSDGAILYVQYYGLIEMNDAVTAALQNGRATNFDQQYFRTTPRFETSDPRYTWLQQGVFVGQGRIIKGPGVEYNIFRVK